MHPDIDALRPKLKEILYDCAVDIRATKAALYLFDGSSRFELATEYGFRGGVRDSADMNDAVVDRCGRGRTPFYVNGVGAEPRFSELLFESSTDRLLVAPLYSRGKLVGFIDMRDKAGKQPFEQSDVPKAQRIAERIVEQFGDKNIFGHRFITLSNVDESHPQTAAPRPARPAPPPPAETAPAKPAVVAPPVQKPAESRSEKLPSLATLVIDARNAASRIAVAPAVETLTALEIESARDVLRSVLLIPGAVVAAFSAFGHLGGVQELAGRSTITDDARNFIHSKLNVWLARRGETAGFLRTNVTTPFGTSSPPIAAADVQKVLTAPLQVGSLQGLCLSVAFSGKPDRLAHELLAVMHAHLQLVLDQSLRRGAIASLRARIAERLVEPELTNYRALRQHSFAVAALAEAFAQYIALAPEEVETVRLVAVVHDAGMRLLDYERLYRKRDLSPEELAFLREHPSVGAALVEPLLGAEVALAVLAHHERIDGRGYPHELRGDEIPLAARVVQLCDAWVAMTDPESYQPAETPATALATIARVAGTQFDAELAARFAEFVRRAHRPL